MVLVQHTHTHTHMYKINSKTCSAGFFFGEVFANKQDLMGACPAPEIAEALNLETWTKKKTVEGVPKDTPPDPTNMDGR